MSVPAILYRRHRFPPAIISHAVYLYYRFAVSYRDVEEMLALRGIVVSYETIRQWCLKFGPLFAMEIRRRRPHPHVHWHLDEMYLRIGGRTWYLWRAVDADGMVLDIVLQARRNPVAAETLLGRLVEGQPTEPEVIVTDKLASYSPAIKKVFPQAEHRAHKGLNNQQREKQSPTNPSAREGAASVQVAHPYAAFPGAVRADPSALLSRSSPASCRNVSYAPGGALCPLGRTDRRRSLITRCIAAGEAASVSPLLALFTLP